MQVYNNSQDGSTSSGNAKPSCSYCRDTSHRSTDCPHVAGDWALFQRFLIPCSDPNNWTNNPITKQSGQSSWNTQETMARWNKEPSEWGKWYIRCEKAHIKQQQAKTRQSRTGTARRASTCGFCGSLYHNRRNCDEMEEYTSRIVNANQKWRQRFYDKFVQELGLSVGAVVKVKTRETYNTLSEEKIGFITSINWDELSMFCFVDQHAVWSKRLQDKFKQSLSIEVMIDGERHKLDFTVAGTSRNDRPTRLLSDEHGPLADNFAGWYSVSYVETIARSETPLDHEWVTQGHEKCAKFVTKKYSREKLDDWNVTRILELMEGIQKGA